MKWLQPVNIRSSATTAERGRNGWTRTVARPELGLDTGALADKEGEGGVAGLDVTIVLLHELPAGDQIGNAPNQKQQV